MSVENIVRERADECCELCEGTEAAILYKISQHHEDADYSLLLCAICRSQLEDASDENHLRCLASSMWSEVPAVKIISYRLLSKLSEAHWARDLLEQMYLEEEHLALAKEGLQSSVQQKDSNGVLLQAGDTVTLIKDLDVKGAGFTAKRGTTVKNISLTDDPGHIEGKVNGVKIVLVTKFLKKL